MRAPERRDGTPSLARAASGENDRVALEQTTCEPVARARAARFRALASGAIVLDATCGLGGDALALAEAGLRVVCADVDFARVARVRERLAKCGLRAEFLQADARHPPISPVRSPAACWLVVDPDRRARGARSLDPARWSPSLAEALTLAKAFEGACIKLPPGLDMELVDSLAPGGSRSLAQWVSAGGELRELALWTGAFAAQAPAGQREALVLARDGGEIGSLCGMPDELVSEGAEIVSRIRWLADPDPAVVRSRLVQTLGSSLGLRPLAPRSAYLVGETEPPPTGLARVWRVLGTSSADPRRVRAMLAEHDIGPIQVLKRGHPDRSEVLERRFRGRGARRGWLAIARLERGHLALALWPASARCGVGDEGIEPPTSSL